MTNSVHFTFHFVTGNHQPLRRTVRIASGGVRTSTLARQMRRDARQQVPVEQYAAAKARRSGARLPTSPTQTDQATRYELRADRPPDVGLPVREGAHVQGRLRSAEGADHAVQARRQLLQRDSAVQADGARLSGRTAGAEAVPGRSDGERGRIDPDGIRGGRVVSGKI